MLREGFPGHDQPPEVSIILVAFNSGDDLFACLESLSRQSTDDFECILVDNASDDLGDLSKYDVAYHRLDRNYGLSYGRNYGVQHASGQIMLFLDDDVIARGDLVEVVKKAFSDSAIVGVRGRVIPKTERNVYNYLARHYDLGNTCVEFPLVTECNIAVRRGALLSVGGFDSSLFGHEGLELSYRLRRLGRIVYMPNAVVYHDFGDDLKHFLTKQYRHGYNMRFFVEDYPEVVRYHRQFTYPAQSGKVCGLGVWKRSQVMCIGLLAEFASLVGGIRYSIGQRFVVR